MLMLFMGLLACDQNSDSKLKTMFSRNRSEFEMLARMAQEDRRVTRIYSDTGDDSAGSSDSLLSKARRAEYQRLFRKLGMGDGMGRRNDFPTAIFFYAGCSGSAVDRDCKGYVYSPVTLKPVYDNLDRLYSGVAFESLSLNWYLFRDSG
jgi:hypothetical protein